MGNLEFGLFLAIVGMGSTLLSLWILGLLASLLKKIFPK
jgi:hypothetical protein